MTRDRTQNRYKCTQMAARILGVLWALCILAFIAWAKV